MNRRNFLRAVAIVPVAAIAAPLAVPTVAAETAYDTFRDWTPIDYAARAEMVSLAFRSGTISLAAARDAMGLSHFSDEELSGAMDDAERWLSGLPFPSFSPHEASE